MYKIGWISDVHLGLKTDGVDRTQEIIDIFKFFTKKCKEEKIDRVVVGGDVFNTSETSEYHISVFLGILNMMSDHFEAIDIMVGNHDAVEDPNRVSCFSFLKRVKKKYGNVSLIDDIKVKHVTTGDLGPIKLTYYPHINSALMAKKGNNLKPQQYIDQKTEKVVQKKIKKRDNHYVFSHLNVKGVEPASEKYLMRKSNVYLPETIINEYEPGKGVPTIIQGHIHSREKYQNINIIGSPLFCGFGEKEDNKYFAILNIPTVGTEKESIEYVQTNCSPFRELNLELYKKITCEIEEIPEIKEFLDSLCKNSIVKFSVSITPENAVYDWGEFKKRVEKEYSPRHVFPIHPKIVRDKTTRNPKQKPKLPYGESIKLFLKDSYRKDKKKVYKLSNEIYEEANANS